MGKTTSDHDFKIHVDPSCLTDSTDLQMPAERVTSNETVVHHDSWSAASPEQDVDVAKEAAQDKEQEDRDSRQIDSIEERIQAAARAVVASIENDSYNGNQDSELSMRTDESYEGEGTEMTYDGTESCVDGTEMSFESGTGDHSELHSGTEASHDTENEHQSEHGDTEGDKQAHYENEHEESSEIHNATECPEVTYESETDHHPEQGEVQDAIANYDSENEHHSDKDHGGDSSSHHDGDIEDDVFSQNSGHSPRSSLNSSDDLHSSEDIYQQKALTSPAVGEEAASSQEDEVVSRIPSTTSYMHPIPDADPTPSKILSRPPFRTPSSVRAMQMSSPTASMFSSPRSTKRRLPTVSRIGTPTSHTSKNRTPTRFKTKKEYPLILLHVTVLPLQWPYSHLMSSPDLPENLQKVKESWRLLQQKLGDAVLERGILLPHPQDSYDILEERLLEALELPVRPRALILKCGHYMGPHDIETPSSDEEGGDYWGRDPETRRKWCDICRREVRLEDRGTEQGKRFTIKTYASNGLMRAGAWAAVWREMERVDIEIEPYIELQQHNELENMVMMSKHVTPVDEVEHGDGFVDEEVTNETENHGDGFVDEEMTNETEHHGDGFVDEEVTNETEHHEYPREPEPEPEPEPELEPELEPEHPREPGPEPEPELEPAHVEAAAEEHIDEDEQRRMDEAELNDILEEERMREIYEQSAPIVEEPEPEPARPQPSRRSSSRASIDEDSLPELLLAAFKVAVRDRKNVVIVLLSVLVLLLALRPRDVVQLPPLLRASTVPEIISDGGRQAIEIGKEAAQCVVEMATGAPTEIAEVIRQKPVQVTEKARTVADVVKEMAPKATDKFEEVKVPMVEETTPKPADKVEEVKAPMVEETASESADKVEEIRAPIAIENIGLEASAKAEDENIDAPMIETKNEATIDETTQDISSDMEDRFPAPIPEVEAIGGQTL
ncbi:hypothetical protein LARI1_G001882 [Lachnellula arida]|uniref:Pathway-specific nitrogen regulator n=1 Tax=Lachnellula arida TaxID=1316785 RepID=A0A8T9BPY7_9HELO|nr:hypothetical protein LARI1_G001882 [Lachnellula arida]